MKAYRSGGTAPLILNLGIMWRWFVYIMSLPLDVRNPFHRWVHLRQGPMPTFWTGDKSSLVGIWTLDRPASRDTTLITHFHLPHLVYYSESSVHTLQVEVSFIFPVTGHPSFSISSWFNHTKLTPITPVLPCSSQRSEEVLNKLHTFYILGVQYSHLTSSFRNMRIHSQLPQCSLAFMLTND
jgi:hypothetical protein